MKIKNVLLIIAVTVAIIASYNIGASRIDFTRGYFDQVMLPMLKICAMWLGVFIVAMICVCSGNYGYSLNTVEPTSETAKPVEIETVKTETVSHATAYELRMKNAQIAYELRMENARRAHEMRMENARCAYELRMGK